LTIGRLGQNLVNRKHFGHFGQIKLFYIPMISRSKYEFLKILGFST